MDTKVVVITGASSGIGAALARILGSKGHKLALAARREPELKHVVEESGKHAIAVTCDVRRRNDIERLKAATLDRFEQIDVWINNAGRGIGRKVLDLTENDFDEMISVNLKSAWYGMQSIVPYFQQHRKGILINISSFLGRVPLATHRSIYSASKAALNVLTSNLRMDLGPQYPNIHICLVMPGIVTTEFAKNALGGTPSIPSSGVMIPQTAGEAAQEIVSLIDNPRSELYTNPALSEIVRQYYQDVAAFEDRMRR